MTRLEAVRAITIKYHVEQVPLCITRNMLISELIRIHCIANDELYYDYDSQEWINSEE